MELEGKVIAYIRVNGEEYRDNNDKRVCIAIVTGYDPDIGITIQDAFDHNIYHWCLHGPSSVLGKQLGVHYPINEFKAEFKAATKMLKWGYINGYVIRKIHRAHTRCPEGVASAPTCPFGQ
jgi:hypothetical protein